MTRLTSCFLDSVYNVVNFVKSFMQVYHNIDFSYCYYRMSKAKAKPRKIDYTDDDSDIGKEVRCEIYPFHMIVFVC